MARDEGDLLLLGLLGFGAYWLLTSWQKQWLNQNCSLWSALTQQCDPFTTSANPYPPGYVYGTETVTQAGAIPPGPTTSTGSIEGGQTLVTSSGRCVYPDGYVWTGAPGSICPIDVPNHGGQSLPI